MRILVTGASGFVGSTLIPRLLDDGHELRALARDPARARAALAKSATHSAFTSPSPPPSPGHQDDPEVEVVKGDALTGAGLSRALKDIEVAYYLIHSMESAPGSSVLFAEREQLAADTFATAAARAGVRRIVYLGGLMPRARIASPHLTSRAAVEKILLTAIPDSVALRSSIVIGARSRPFRFLVHLVERMPVLALPDWHRFRTQPIDARDVTEMLAAAAYVPEAGGRSLDVGGPDLLSYGAMIERIAEAMLVHRPTLKLKLTLTGVAARVAAAIATEDAELILPLMQSLASDLLPADDHADELLGVRLHSFASAVERALRDWEAVEPLSAR